MRALANDREITATLGVPGAAASRRRPGSAPGSSAARRGCSSPDLLTSLDYAALTFLVIASLAAALIGRLQSLWATLVGGLAVGLAQAVLSAVHQRVSAYRRRRRSCSRSSRCSGCRAGASSRSRGRRSNARERRARNRGRGSDAADERAATSSAGRSSAAVVIAAFLAIVLFVLPTFVGADWITT